MALFPEKVVFKNSATGLLSVLAEAAPGEINALVPGELLLFRETDGFRLYSLSISGSVVQVGARIKNENKGSLTVTNFGEGSSSFVLNDGSVVAANIPDASVTSIKFAAPLSIDKGGTGETTQATAINALLPSQAGNTNKVLTTDGVNIFWDSKKAVLNDYDNIDTVSVLPSSGDCLAWDSGASNWVPDQDIREGVVPASATAAGRPGELAFDSSYLYSCVGVNRWKRVPLSSWNYAQILPLLISSAASINSPTKIGPPIPELVGIGTEIISRTPSVPWPAGHRVTDIGIFVMFCDNTTTALTGGWTLIAQTSKLRVYYKYALSSAEPNVTFTTGNFDFQGQVIVFRNIVGGNPLDGVASLTTAAAGTMPQLQPLSVTTTTSNCAVLYFQAMGSVCGTAGGCLVATNGTLEPGLYYDYEAFNDGSVVGVIQTHAGRKFSPGVASSGITYTSGGFINGYAINQITFALKQKPGVVAGVLPPAKDTVVAVPPLTAGYVDPFWTDVTLLMSMDGANGSTTFTDKTANNHVFLAYNGAQISTAQSRFGGSSGLFDGVDDLIASPDNSSTGSALISNWWTSSYTFECWVRMTALTGSRGTLFYSRPGGGGLSGTFYGTLGSTSSGAFRMEWTNSGQTFLGQSVTSGAGVVSLNTWQHLAMTYDIATSTIRLFVNGVIVATRTGSLLGTPVVSGPVFIGGQTFNGYLDELRITRNVARYTSNFTPPTKEFPSR